MPRITLLTDFGTVDGYAAAMKGVIAAIAPDAALDDASHDIPPGDIHAAAWAIARYWRRYPEGTIHLAVIDPGVGGSRRAIAVRAGGRLFVAPDNGLLSRVFLDAPPERIVALENPRYRAESVSNTFHGRDLFAPAAAHLAAGVPLDDLGPVVTDPVRLRIPSFVVTPDGIRGEVVHVDRFGNLVTNIPADWASAGTVRLGRTELGRARRTYGDVAPGEPLALVGSAGLLEVAVRDGSAAVWLEAGLGTAVEVVRGG